MADHVTASIVVNFKAAGSNAAGILSAEVDGREDGLNLGKTSFVPGDSVGVLVYKGDDVKVDAVSSSAGSISYLGTQLVTITELVQFANVNTASVNKPIASINSTKWLGNDGGNVSLTDQVNLKIANPVVGVLKITYTSIARGYRLSGVPHPLSGETEYDVLVYVEGSFA